MIDGWDRYLGIEKEFIEASYYMSLDNDNAYSEFLTKETILMGSLIEAAIKKLCANLGEVNTGNMGQYKTTILQGAPGIRRFGSKLIRSGRVITPFKDLETHKKIKWWDVFMNTKHSLVDENASCRNALEMLSAYQLLLVIAEIFDASNDDKDKIVAYTYFNSPQLLVPDDN